MIIKLEKFGTTLLGRQFGIESLSTLEPSLRDMKNKEEVMVDFKGVITFTPSWGDEFLTPLFNRFSKKLTLKNTKNLSVQATLEIIEEIHKIKFKIKK